jgi:hypothetical protein
MPDGAIGGHGFPAANAGSLECNGPGGKFNQAELASKIVHFASVEDFDAIVAMPRRVD